MPNTIDQKTKTTKADVNATQDNGHTSNSILEDELKVQIARLKDLNLEDLRVRWRKLFRTPAPPHLPRYLLLRVISYRMQADALGDLNRESIQYLKQIALSRLNRLTKPTNRGSKAPPPIPPVLDKRPLKPGTILEREHDGQLHRVVVKEAGFSWNETTYHSLSEAAHAITGTKWNGPRFFGLRDKSPSKPSLKQEEAVQ